MNILWLASVECRYLWVLSICAASACYTNKWNSEKSGNSVSIGLCVRDRRIIARISTSPFCLHITDWVILIRVFFCRALSSPYLHVRDFLLDDLLLNSNKCQIGAAYGDELVRCFVSFDRYRHTSNDIFVIILFFTRSLAVFNRHIK